MATNQQTKQSKTKPNKTSQLDNSLIRGSIPIIITMLVLQSTSIGQRFGQTKCLSFGIMSVVAVVGCLFWTAMGRSDDEGTAEQFPESKAG